MQVGGQKYFERNCSAIRSSRVDQHVVQRSIAIGGVEIFDLRHPDMIQSGRKRGLRKDVCGPSHNGAIHKGEPYQEIKVTSGETLSFQANASHVSMLPIGGY